MEFGKKEIIGIIAGIIIIAGDLIFLRDMKKF